MICEKIMLYDDRDDVFVDTYVPSESSEYQIGIKREAILICPGGGYQYTSDREAEFVALAFASKGFSAFVLRYSVAKNAAMPTPIIEAAKAMVLIRDNAEKWNVNTSKIAICGFSAGGHIASILSTKWHEPFLKEAIGRDNELFKPNAQVLGYPCIVWPNERCAQYSTQIKSDDLETLKKNYPMQTDEKRNFDINKIFPVHDGYFYCDSAEIMHETLIGNPNYTTKDLEKYSSNLFVSDKTPPAFVWTTWGDTTVASTDSIAYVDALTRHGINVEFHMFSKGDHAYAMAEEQTASCSNQINPVVASWFSLAIEWLRFIWE